QAEPEFQIHRAVDTSEGVLADPLVKPNGKQKPSVTDLLQKISAQGDDLPSTRQLMARHIHLAEKHGEESDNHIEHEDEEGGEDECEIDLEKKDIEELSIREVDAKDAGQRHQIPQSSCPLTAVLPHTSLELTPQDLDQQSSFIIECHY
ncbi:unnamed protein product, partial [Protopolystoma xenopodis]